MYFVYLTPFRDDPIQTGFRVARFQCRGSPVGIAELFDDHVLRYGVQTDCVPLARTAIASAGALEEMRKHFTGWAEHSLFLT